MAFSRLMVGESPSMSTEAALLGVPSVLISSWAGRVGNMQVLEREFKLMQVFDQGKDAIPAALNIANSPPSRSLSQRVRSALVRNLECITDVVNHHIQELLGKVHA